VLFEQWLVLIAVGRIAPFNKTAEDHGRGTAGEENLVAIFCVPSSLDRIFLLKSDAFLRDNYRVMLDKTGFY